MDGGPGAGADTRTSCRNGAVLLEQFAEQEPDVFLELSNGAGDRFVGLVSPDYVTDEDFNGPGCGTCTTGQVQVTLR
ncbi:MAG: hypothetical protein HC923_06560 [Myxococcales bacterium]|nr:hypothetical protein [Myxococcales bacterium]